MKKVDEITRQKMQNSDNTSSQHSNGLKNRLSAKYDEQMGSGSQENDGLRKSASDDSMPNIVRHGYGV